MLGTTIAHYKITAKLGQGGMGEVYRATDSKLDREVAIKVLPESVARDKERLARFEREAKTLAQLNHPNIAGVHGLERSGDTQALVLELVEGEDLYERLKRGPLPLDEALDVCKQICEALEVAHEKGIIHRDLKPGNIKITDDGKVKVLDFGLAKGLSEESDLSNSTLNEDSPTITDAFTQPGTILGTAAYMAPEQARGKQVDKRGDIWAFGCVLFECLTGRKAFQGEDVTETLSKIIQVAPDWNSLPADTPPIIQILLRKCLVKERRQRLRDIGDARIDLQAAIDNPSSFLVHQTHPGPNEIKAKKGLHPLLVLILLIAVVGVTWFFKPISTTPARREPRAFQIYLDETNTLERAELHNQLSISRESNAIVYRTRQGGFWLIDLESINAKHEPLNIDDLEYLNNPFLSPNGKGLGFITQTKLQTLDIDRVGAHPTTIIEDLEYYEFYGADWSTKDDVVFARQNKGIFLSTKTRTNLRPITKPRENEQHAYPQFLPGGTHVLFTVYETEKDEVKTRFPAIVQVNDDNEDHSYKDYKDYKELKTSEGRIEGDFFRFVQTKKSGYLLYFEDKKLYARPFNISNHNITDPAEVILINVHQSVHRRLFYDVSNANNGTLIYQKANTEQRSLGWYDGNNNFEEIRITPSECKDISLSPNQKNIALVVNDSIYILNISNGSLETLAHEVIYNYKDRPVWSPDSKLIYYKKRNTDGDIELMEQSVELKINSKKITNMEDSTLKIKQVTEDAIYAFSSERDPSANFFKYSFSDHETGWIPMPVPLPEHTEQNPKVSPNGKYMAFHTKSIGPHGSEFKLWIWSMEADSSPIEVDTGVDPYWTEDKLFYQSDNDIKCITPFDEDGHLKTPFDKKVAFKSSELIRHPISSWQVKSDNSQMLLLKDDPLENRLEIVTDWFTYLDDKFSPQSD